MGRLKDAPWISSPVFCLKEIPSGFSLQISWKIFLKSIPHTFPSRNWFKDCPQSLVSIRRFVLECFVYRLPLRIFIFSLRIFPKEIPFGFSWKISSRIVLKEIVQHTEREREGGGEREQERKRDRERERERGCLMSVSKEGRQEEGDDPTLS